MAPRILLVPPNPEFVAIARDMAPPGFELVIARPGTPEFTAALPGTVYLIGVPELPMEDGFYRAAPRLRRVQLVSAGYDRVDIEAARRAGVPVANNGGDNS